MFGASSSAPAFELERVGGDPCSMAERNVSWSPKSTDFSVESLGSVTAPIARDEAAAWTDATTFTFIEKAQSAPCDTGDGVVGMRFADKLCDGSSFGPNVLAITAYSFNRSTGEMTMAEITFNVGADSLSDQATFRHVALHEMGHVLGLDHSDACGDSGANSVMKAVLRRGDPRFSKPGSDDVAGADFVYGAEPTPTGSPPVATPTMAQSSSGSSRSSGGGCAMRSDSCGGLLWLLAGGMLCGALLRPRSASTPPG